MSALNAAPGDSIQVGITASNEGTATVVVDLYVAILLPPAAGPSFGCPNGDALVFVGGGANPFHLTCASAPPQTFPALLPNVTFAPGARTTNSALLNFPWPASAPAGTYTFAIVATPPGAFSDGEIGPNDMTAFYLSVLTSTALLPDVYRGEITLSGRTPDLVPGCFVEVRLTNTVEANLPQLLFKLFVGGTCTIEFIFQGLCAAILPQVTHCDPSTRPLEVPLQLEQPTTFTGEYAPPGTDEYVVVRGNVGGGFAVGDITTNFLLGCPPSLGAACPLTAHFFLPRVD